VVRRLPRLDFDNHLHFNRYVEGQLGHDLIRPEQERLRDGETERLLGVPAVAIPVAALLA
jgi:hypothetical protein